MGVGFKSLQDNIDTTTPAGKLTFHLLAALAEFERDIISTRTKARLEAAKSRRSPKGIIQKSARQSALGRKFIYRK